MIKTAENVAKEVGVTREKCDALALRRYEQYKNALKLGYTKTIGEIYEAAGVRFDFSKKYDIENSCFTKPSGGWDCIGSAI